MRYRRYLGLVWALAAAIAWIVLASRTPTSTFHFAPLVVGAVWVVVDGYSEAGSTPHRAVNAAIVGFALAALATILLAVRGDLAGPVFWQEGPDSPVVFEHILFAAAGSAFGLVLALRRANRVPAATDLSIR